MSEHVDNPEPEDEEVGRMSEPAIEERHDDGEEERWIESESRRGDPWDDRDGEAIPPRPRGRLLRPVPLALIALTIAAAGFLGGVLAQKGSEGSSGAAAGGLPSFAAAKEGGGLPTAAEGESGEGGGTEGSPSAEGASDLPSFGGSSAAASGTVTSIEGHTIYVKESDGTVVAVKAGDGASVTRESNVAAKKIHPGDSVTVEGAKHGSTVKASSIAATEAGVESSAGFTPPTGASGAAGGSEGEASVESLFEE